MRIASWNVNGLRAVAKRNFLTWVKESDFDILCLQEIKVGQELLPLELKEIAGYESYFSFAEKKGYSGVAVYIKQKPMRVDSEVLQNKQFNQEGRALLLEFEEFALLNIYIPHGGRDQSKLEYKLKVYSDLLGFLKAYTGKPLIIAGDLNVAHTDIDLARPKQNRNNIMFTPGEREQLDRLTELGFVDSFRSLNQNGGHYTWWPYVANAREHNIGWRIDYIFVARTLAGKVENAEILDSVFGSDHCPVAVSVEIGTG